MVERWYGNHSLNGAQFQRYFLMCTVHTNHRGTQKWPVVLFPPQNLQLQSDMVPVLTQATDQAMARSEAVIITHGMLWRYQ